MKSLLSVAAVLATVGAHDASAQYPVRPITIVVAYAPGGGNDVAARIMARALTPKLGQQLIVENRPGAGGQIGTKYAADASPDGYTLMLGTWSTHSSNPALFPKSVKYDPIRDFVPIVRMCDTPFTLDVPKSSPTKSLRDLIGAARRNPGKYNYGSFGQGSSNHLVTEYFKLKTSIDIVHVPYKGAAPALTDLLAGSIDMMFGTPSTTVRHHVAGTLRTLAVTGRRRSTLMPDVPTMAEAGVEDFVITSWFGLLAPKGTPTSIVKRLETASLSALGDADVLKQLAELGFDLIGENSGEFAAFLEKDVRTWRNFIEKAGLRMDGQ